MNIIFFGVLAGVTCVIACLIAIGDQALGYNARRD